MQTVIKNQPVLVTQNMYMKIIGGGTSYLKNTVKHIFFNTLIIVYKIARDSYRDHFQKYRAHG